jgi:transcriptional regulator with XRE-family HTH domain
MRTKKQIALPALLIDFKEILNKYMWDERIRVDLMAKKAGVSAPTISGISKGRMTNISFKKLAQVANACDYNITGIQFEKIEKPELVVENK